jgi:hypothetical protein
MNNKGELMPGGTVARPGKSDKEHLVGSWILISLSAGDGAKETMPYGPNPKGTICIRQSHDRDAGGEHADRARMHRLFRDLQHDEATHVITVNVGAARSRISTAARRRALVQRRRGHLSQSGAVDGRRHRQGDLPARQIAGLTARRYCRRGSPCPTWRSPP